MLLKSKIHLSFEKKYTAEIKQDTGILKLNISKLKKAIIVQTMSMKTLKSLEKLFILH